MSHEMYNKIPPLLITVYFHVHLEQHDCFVDWIYEFFFKIECLGDFWIRQKVTDIDLVLVSGRKMNPISSRPI